MATSMVLLESGLIVAQKLSLDIYDGLDHNLVEIPEIKSENDNITDITLSSDNKQIAVLTSTSKRLLVYNLDDISNPKLFTLPRAASKARFIEKDNNVLIADKTGDVLKINICDETSKEVKLFGHLSLLLDILLTDDNQYIITCDRDEKIRVSCYPNTYNIQTYCLGHKEFVKYLHLLPHNRSYLTSASGDGAIKIWNYVTGELCYTIDTKNDNEDSIQNKFIKTMDEEGIEVACLPIVSYTACKLTENSSLAAVTIYNQNKVLIYNIQEKENSKLGHSSENIPLKYFPASIQFSRDSLYVFNNNDNIIEVFDIQNRFSLKRHINVFKGKSIKNYESESDSIKVLFKRKFDNVQEYIERKKQRLEKKK